MEKTGKIFIVGIGPGNGEYMCGRAIEAIREAEVIIGYKTYIALIEHMITNQEVINSGMRKEVERCHLTLDRALEGKKVAIISSGDAGVYGMAGIMLEVIHERNAEIETEIIPGITAASAAAAVLGAPMMHDFAVLSLSDLLTDWQLIRKRIEYASMGDFVIALYNPKSMGRVSQIEEARDIMLQHKGPNTPVGIVRNAMREEQTVIITDLAHMLEHDIDMFTVVVIGNQKTYVRNGKIITPRGYHL